MEKVFTKYNYQSWCSLIFDGLYDSGLYYSDKEFYNDDGESVPYEFDDWNAFARDIGAMVVSEIVERIPDNIIRNMELTCINRPKEYNFSSDKLQVDLEVDMDALKQFLIDHREHFDAYLHNNWTSCSGFWSFVPNYFDGFMKEYYQQMDVAIEYYLLYMIYGEFKTIGEFDCYDSFFQRTILGEADLIFYEHAYEVDEKGCKVERV